MHEFEKSKEKRPKKKKKEKRTTHQILAAINSTGLDSITSDYFLKYFLFKNIFK
jgi:hypothetical protein